VVSLVRVVVPGVKRSAAHTSTVVGRKEANVEHASLITTGHGAGAGRRATNVLCQSCDVDEARLVSASRHSASKRVSETGEGGDEGRDRARAGQCGNNNGGELHLVVSCLNEGLGGEWCGLCWRMC